MENTTKMTPKDFFLHLGLVATLYVSTVALITFVFAMLNLALPDAMEYYQLESARSSISWALSVFIVVYPVFVYLLFVVSRYLRNNAGKASVTIRRWFIYLTIFITAVTMIIDGIVLLTTFLQGEQLTLRFLLKVLTIVIVALTIFWFSIKELKETFITEPQTLKKTVLITSAVLLVLIIVGFIQMGSPRHARLVLEDTQRVNDLSMTQSHLVEYWRTTGTLPATLETLNDPLQYIQVPVDPVTGAAYEYRTTGALSFELCATFSTASDAKMNAQLSHARPMYDAFGGVDDYFAHGVGRTCFARTIDPTRIQQLKPAF